VLITNAPYIGKKRKILKIRQYLDLSTLFYTSYAQLLWKTSTKNVPAAFSSVEVSHRQGDAKFCNAASAELLQE
jgi:hypothetical protein